MAAILLLQTKHLSPQAQQGLQHSGMIPLDHQVFDIDPNKFEAADLVIFKNPTGQMVILKTIFHSNKILEHLKKLR